MKINVVRSGFNRIEVKGSDSVTVDLDDPNLPYRFYGMLKCLGAQARYTAENSSAPGAERRLKLFANTAVDEVFGEGACANIFGEPLPSLEMQIGFFDALFPYFAEEGKRRQRRMNKYNAGRNGNAKYNS